MKYSLRPAFVCTVGLLAAASWASGQTVWNDTSTDWNAPGSWTAGAPDSATVAELPFSAGIGNQPALTANGSALGLVADNSGDDYTVGGAGFVLSLGASGIASSGAGNLTLLAGLELTDAQSWNANAGSGNLVRVLGNLTGAADLTIANATNSKNGDDEDLAPFRSLSKVSIR